MSNATRVAVRPPSPKMQFQERLKVLEPRIAEIAAAHIDPARMVKMALMACEKVPQLMECSPKSVFMGLLQAAEMGLEVGSGFGHAYLLPFKGEATLVVGYQGYIELMYRTGHVSSVRAALCFEGDAWEYEEGTTPRIVHKPDLDADRTPETLRFAYAVVHLTSGGPPVQMVMTKKEIEATRKRSPSASSSKSPWVTDYLAMAQKSPIRRIAKMLPKSRELAQALDIDENPDSESVKRWQSDLDQALSGEVEASTTPAPEVSTDD
jgi:recombination protein RecT